MRAARVMIDVGLHTRGMTFDDAVKILTDRVHLEHELAVSEVKRYTESPTQPLSYLVGREQLFALRERYRQREKERFSQRLTLLYANGRIGLLSEKPAEKAKPEEAGDAERSSADGKAHVCPADA